MAEVSEAAATAEEGGGTLLQFAPTAVALVSATTLRHRHKYLQGF